MDILVETMEVKLTEDEVKDIIAEKVSTLFPGYDVKPENVDFQLSMRSVGYFADESIKSYISSVTVHCNKDKED